jgi:murein hydrolase activator
VLSPARVTEDRAERSPLRHPGRALCLIALALLCAAAPAAKRTAAQAQAELERTRARIRAVTAAVHGQVADRDAAAYALAGAETALAAARNRLGDLRAQRAAGEAQLKLLAAEQAQAERALDSERAALSGQVRAAYQSGRGESLKLLLSAEDPATLGRTLAYYQYLSRARAVRIDSIRAQMAHLETIEAELSVASQHLQGLEREQAEAVDSAAGARRTREHALVRIKAELDSNRTELRRLKANAASLDDLVRRLHEALAQAPADQDFESPGARAFAQARGHLPWPAHGKVAAHYGDTRPGGLAWQGVLLETAPGAQVRAPYAGRVVYADWLPGVGLLMIVDHGGGYLTLYGHNERLYRSVGDAVAPGELLAASGAGAGQPAPELYFEIRHGTRTLDPGDWLKGAPAR